MSEAEEHGPGQKRGAPTAAAGGGGGGGGGPQVSERNKDRKRKSVLGDSRSGEHRALSHRKAARLVDRSGRSSGIRKRNSTARIKRGVEGSAGDKRILRSDVAKEREGSRSITNKRNGVDRVSREEGVRVEKKRVSRSDIAKRRKVASVHLKEVTEEAVLSTDQNANISSTDAEVLRSDVAEQSVESGIGSTDRKKVREETSISKTKATEEVAPGAFDEQINCEEIKVKKKKIRKSGGAKRRVEDKIKDVRVGKKRITRSCVAKQRDEGGNSKKKVSISKSNGMELIKCDEESKIEEKRITRSDVAKQRGESDTIQKKVSESGLGKKRSREASDAETIGKKPKIESLGCRQDQSRQKDGPSERKMRPVLKKTNCLESEKIRQIKRSGQRTHKRLTNGARPVSIKREDFGITHHKGTSLLGRGGVLKALSCNKKAGRFQKSSIRRENEENRKSSRPPNSYGGRKNLRKSRSTVSVDTSQLSMKKTSSAEKKISHELKIGSKPDNADSSNGNIEVTVKGESRFTSETPFSTRQIEEAARIERRIAKQKLRDRIKDLLLNAGWKIDLRPRKGKGYDDSVYISPQGSGYWSITKAYDVFQSQMNCPCDGKGKNSSGKLSKKSKGSDHNLDRTGSSLSAIPKEALSLLKKVMVNKRRSKAEIEEAKKKLEGGSRNKKAKGATGIKHPKNKHSKDKGREVKERIKKSSIVGSSDKGIVGYTRKKPHPGRDREKRRGMALLARGSNQETGTGTDVYVPFLWKRTILSWMIDLGTTPASGKVKYMNQNHTQAMLEGWITRNGIHCSCCSKILTVSTFEIHAGSKLSQPYRNIHLEEAGVSLLQCQIKAWEKQDESVRRSFYAIDTDGDDPNDDTCGICGDGGDLICCDGCPSTFHLSCLGIKMLPPGDWHCMNCSCRFCGLVSGADAHENGVTVSPLFSCSQCEEKYHQKCVPDGNSIPVCSNLPYVSFCGQSCKKLFERLQRLLGVKNDLEAGFSWTLLQRLDEDLPESVCALDQRVECNSKIAVALAVMDECFLPIIDQRSGINLIHNVVYNCGSNFNRLNYRGFYTFILERDDEIISAASLRIHGIRLAEMPFIGTRNMYRRQGMCRRLLNGIESALCSLNIEKMIIPAISELTDTWTNVFGFKPIEVSQKQEVRSINMLVFPGTGLLLKLLRKEGSSEHCKTADGVDKFEPDIKHNHTPEVANESSVCSFLGLEPSTSDEVIVQCEHEAKNIEPGMSSDSSDAPQALEYKSSETATNEDLLLHSGTVYYEELMVDNNLQTFSLEPEIKLPSEGIVHDNSEEKVRGACVVRNLPPVNDTSVKHTSHIRCTYPNASTLHDSGANTATNMPTVDGSLLPHLCEVQCTSPDAIASTLRDSSGIDLHIPVSSLGLSFDATHYYGSEITSKSSVVFPIEHGFHTSTEHIVVDNHNTIHQVGSLQPNFGEHFGSCNSQINAGPLGAVANKFLTSSSEPTIHAVDEGVVSSVQELKPSAVRPKPFADDGDAELCASDVVKASLYVAPGKVSQDSCTSSASCDTDLISIHAASVHSVEMSIQLNSELQQKPSESLCEADHRFTDKPHHDKDDLVNSLNVTSLPEPTVSFNGGNVQNSYATNDDAGYVEKNLCALGKSSVQYTRGMVKSSDSPYVLTPYRGGNHILHMVAKGSALLTPGVANSCASTEGVVLDNHCERFEDGSLAVSHCAIAEASEDYAGEGISDLNGVVSDYSNLTSGGPLNKFSVSTGIVQHSLTITNQTAITIPVEPGHACYEGEHDTNNLKAYASGECSIHHASKVVSKSLDNGLQSTLEYADVGNVRHTKLIYGSHSSGVSPLSAGMVGNSIVARHDSAD